MKQFAALARVSSREQEREGFSLEVQEDALKRYATQAGGEIVKFFKIAETASKGEERKTFRELIAYAKKNAAFLDGLLFYKVDRASRNLFDYVELERLESEYDLPFISVSQPTENTPAGRMMRRTLANMASFYTEQQSVDVREGLSRRVQEGWFVGLAPYGYRNIRKDGRGIIEVDSEAAANVKRIFHLYAYENLTLDGVVERINAEGRTWRQSQPKFPRSSVHNILKDRAYIGELLHKGEWYPGKHEPLIDRPTWDRVQVLLGGQNYHCHALTYGGEWMTCAHCGHPVTGECKTKMTKGGPRSYVYYRCAKYTKAGHPRIRVPEADLDRQVLAIFDRMRIEDESVRDWFRTVLARRLGTHRRSRWHSERNSSVRKRCSCSSRTGSSTCGWPMTSTRKRSAERARKSATGLPRSSSRSKLSTAHTTKTPSWRPKCLNFRKRFASSGLPPITTQSVESSKSCV